MTIQKLMKWHMKSKKLYSIIGIVFVAIVTILAFVFNDFVESYKSLGYIGMFLACFVSNATIMIPASSSFVVAEFSLIYSPIVVGIICGLGVALGEMTGYLAGYSSKQLLNIDTDKKLFVLFSKKPVVTTFLFSLIPWPLFDLVGIMAGLIKMKWYAFFLSCFLGKFLKFLLLSTIIVFICEQYQFFSYESVVDCFLK